MDEQPGTRRRIRPIRGLLVAGVAIAGLLGVLDIAVTRVPWAPQWREPESMVRVYFDVAREQNLPTWVNVCLLTLAAAIAGLVAALARVTRDPSALPWAVFALLCTCLSLDDMTSLHERLDPLGRRLGGGSGLTYAAWLVPGALVAVVMVVAVVVLVRRTGRTTRLLLLAGLGCLLAGALGFEAVSNAVLEERGFSRSYAWLLSTEEFLETIGAVLLLAGTVSGLRITAIGRSLLVELARPGGPHTTR